jgi:hypothetical protein
MEDTMINSKKTAFLVVLTFVLLPAMSQAADIDLEINANSSDVEVDLESGFLPYETPIFFGVGAISSDQDYWISNIRVVFIDQVLVPPLNLGLGFRVAYGKADIFDTDYDLAALCFHFLGRYDFRKRVTSKLPISAGASFSIAPEVLSSGDAERYAEFRITASFHINKSAAVLVGYRREEARFEGAVEADLDDDDVFFGFKLSF